MSDMPPCLPVIGIDPSANSTGVVVLGPDLVVRYAGTISTGCTGPARLHAIHMALSAIADQYGPFEVAVRENYAVGATNMPYLAGEVGGVVEITIYPRSGSFHHCAPKALKKFAAGNASATKKEMMASVLTRYGFATTSDDIADAYALARVAACVAGYATVTDRPGMEVLHAMATTAAEGPKKRRRSVRRSPSVSATDTAA